MRVIVREDLGGFKLWECIREPGWFKIYDYALKRFLNESETRELLGALEEFFGTGCLSEHEG